MAAIHVKRRLYDSGFACYSMKIILCALNDNVNYMFKLVRNWFISLYLPHDYFVHPHDLDNAEILYLNCIYLNPQSAVLNSTVLCISTVSQDC